jgi:membrane protein DedA with SNARE-associated domain
MRLMLHGWAEQLTSVAIERFTYLGIFLVLLMASLGVPIPEEIPIIASAVLSHDGPLRWWIALPVSLVGVLSGDVVLYWVGFHWGERVMNWRVVRLILSPEREAWLKTAFRRHAVKTVFTARHLMGLRAAAFLTAGVARVPFWTFFLTDAGSAMLSVPLGFVLAYLFTDQLEELLTDVRRTERWVGLAVVVMVALAAAFAVWRSRRQVAAEAAADRAAEERERGLA